MDSAVASTHHKHLQRAQPNDQINGPRVSFNKDVHVKRIGNRTNEPSNVYNFNGNTSPQPPYKREIPQDLTEKELLKEAEKVIAQSGRIKCTADTPSSLAGIRLQNSSIEERKFNSLPHRKTKSKQLGRSVSDASQKKPKKSSIFNLFSKRSDPNINTVGVGIGNANDIVDGRNETSSINQKRARKVVGRSKSDVGYNSSDSAGNSSGRGKNQIVDRKRIKIPDSDESMTKVKKKSQLSPISENPPIGKNFNFTPDERNILRNTKSEEKTITSSSPSPLLRSNNNHTNNVDVKFERDNSPLRYHTLPTQAAHSQSLENLHSSQLPQQKLPLTKGLKIDGMVKRLSMDRFSPPLTFNSPAFSYTRPIEPIVYAQVLRDENGEKPKPTTTNITIERERSPYRDQVNSLYNGSRSKQFFGIDRAAPELHLSNNSDEDEGLGFEEKKPFHDDYFRTINNLSRQSSEPPIIPTLRPSYGSIERLANRRKLLESKIHERSFDFGRDLNSRTHIVPIKCGIDDNPIQRNKLNTPKVNDPKQPTERPTLLSPTRKQWIKQPKYYPETNLEDDFCNDMDTIRREQERQRHKYYLDSKIGKISPKNGRRVIDLGYIDQYDDSNRVNNNNSHIINQNLHHNQRAKSPKTEVEWLGKGSAEPHIIRIENEHRRKLDKVDSGIEHDFKRDQSETRTNSRSRRFRMPGNIKNITELFLKRECQHSESLHPSKKRYEFVFRERSIDDGSHFDPRLDKYPEQHKSRSTSTRSSPHSDDGKKSVKKFDGLKIMKEIFSMGSKKKQPHDPNKGSNSSRITNRDIVDISNRRRLSTPKASPIPKRIPSQKSSKMSHVSSHCSDASVTSAPKTSWFKSLERLSRKKAKTPDGKKAATVKRSNTTLSRPTYQRAQSPSPDVKQPVQQNLRFFGDTDLESLSKASNGNGRKRTLLSPNNSHSMQNLRSNRNQSRTADNSRHVRSAASMQNLNSDFRTKYLPDLSESTSENENIAGNRKFDHPVHHSTPNSNSKHIHRRQYHSMEYLENGNEKIKEKVRDSNRSELNSPRNNTLDRNREPKHSSPHRSALREKNGRSSNDKHHLPPIAPTKPAREFDRRRALSSDRFLDSSGTEGDSSQQSVVYLHATTIGHIPQPYVASSRRSSASRDELSSIKSKSSSPLQPMTRTVARSVSMSAPWTPRHISDSYEINYSQTMQNPKKKASNLTKDHLRKARSRDDVSSQRSSTLPKSSTLPRK